MRNLNITKGNQNSIINHKARDITSSAAPTNSEGKGFDIGPAATNKVGESYSNTHLSPGPRGRKHY